MLLYVYKSNPILCYGKLIMYVCICHDVKSSQIKTAIKQGVDTLESLEKELLVGSCCGCCTPMVQDLLDEHFAKFPNSERIGELAYSA